MAEFYERMQGIASNLLTRFNQGVIELGKVTPGTGPIHNPGPPGVAWALLKGAARAVNGKELFSSNGAISKPDSLLISGDLVVVAKVVAGVTPRAGDQIRFGGPSGEVWRVIKFDPVPTAGTTVAWKIYIRRG